MNPTQLSPSKRWTTLPGSSRKARIIGAGAIFLAVCAFGAAAIAPLPDASDLPVKSIAQDLALPNLSDQIAALQQEPQQFIHEEKVRPGDSLASLLNRLGVDDQEAVAFIKSDRVAKGVMQLKTGKRVQAETDDNGQLQWLHATVVDSQDMPVKTISISRKNNKLVAQEAAPKLERRVEMRARTITNSLYSATDASTDGGKLPDSIVAQIIEMFSTSIDFRSDLNRGVTYQSVWFDDPSSKAGGGYYTFDGKALKRGFLKSPLEFSRISSGFSMRVHPISGNWKAHKGIDFAAALGTPIRASGDGVIDFQGVSGGYGNLVVIKHWANYSTAYAHMSRFSSNLHKGSKVSQGDVIGYVGSTGWSTGAHLHYEFRVNNEARDPNSLNVIALAPLSPSEMARFKMAAADMTHRFSLLRPGAGQAMAAR